LVSFFWCRGYGAVTPSIRFETDDLVYRLLTFFQMFVVIGIAVEVPQAILGHTQGFAVTYLTARIVLLVLLVRALYYVVEARPLMQLYKQTI
jgi:low temperature requirement protein LtrA